MQMERSVISCFLLSLFLHSTVWLADCAVAGQCPKVLIASAWQ